MACIDNLEIHTGMHLVALYFNWEAVLFTVTAFLSKFDHKLTLVELSDYALYPNSAYSMKLKLRLLRLWVQNRRKTNSQNWQKLIQ